MIETDKRKAIYLLHQQDLSGRQLARQFGLSRNTIRQIIALKGELPVIDRKDKKQIDPELLRRLYEQCQGRVQRVAGIAGSTILGSGEVALILDVPQLVQRAIAHEGRDTGGAPRARFLAA